MPTSQLAGIALSANECAKNPGENAWPITYRSPDGDWIGAFDHDEIVFQGRAPAHAADMYACRLRAAGDLFGIGPPSAACCRTDGGC